MSALKLPEGYLTGPFEIHATGTGTGAWLEIREQGSDPDDSDICRSATIAVKCVHNGIEDYSPTSKEWEPTENAELITATMELFCIAPEMGEKIQELEEKLSWAEMSLGVQKRDLAEAEAHAKRMYEFQCEWQNKAEAALRHIAHLEAALGIPEGAEVFVLGRAMKEGARTAQGEKLDYIKTQTLHCFENQKLGIRIWVWDNGRIPSGGHLYCIKEGA